MNKKVEYILKEKHLSEDKLILLVVSGDASWLPKKNFTPFSEYVVYVEEEMLTFFYVKAKGVFKKTYEVEEVTTLKYSDVEHAEFGIGSGKMIFLQLVVDGELNAIVSKKDEQYQLLVKYFNAKKEIDGLDVYSNFIK